MPKIRRPTHAGSWYESKGPVLASQIQEWMSAVDVPDIKGVQAVIVPHAGYSYCGHVMAYAYKHIDATKHSRVFLLGPSHHHYTRKCLLSPAATYATPLGALPIDTELYQHLRVSGLFEEMDSDVDEAEHSLELHTPYIAAVMGSQPFTLVPIMVGALTLETEAAYGRLLAPYLDDPANLFIISSDFCHWGTRFSYTPHDKAQGPIWQYVQALDKRGMDAIEAGNPVGFASYLQQTRNTICGRHPIAIFLHMVQHARSKPRISFVKYDQSSKATAPTHSSVSYAAAVAVAGPPPPAEQ